MAVLTRGPDIQKRLAKLHGLRLYEAIGQSSADACQLMDSLSFNQFTRVLGMLVPQSFLQQGGQGPWQVQLLDILDWCWVTKPLLLSAMTITTIE